MSSFLPVSQLFNQSAIYVIPTFQRPYAWEEPQWADLLRDIDNAIQKQSPTHYFAAIHTIKVSPVDPMWLNYTDAANPDIQRLNQCQFQTDTNYDVHLVVDGQQRMIALFALLECFRHVNNRYVEISDDYKIPKLILNPAADHADWRVLLGLDKGALHQDMRSQKRLRDMFLYFQGKKISAYPPTHYKFLIGGNCTLQPIVLPTGSSLAPFLTLNDRGRDLTYLEKMKSLVMEADENGGFGLATQINTSFGAAYRSIDQKGSQLDENGFLRQLGIWLWEGKSVTDEPVHNMALDKLYAVYREQLSQSATNVMPLVQNIIDNINQLSKHHNELVVSYKNALNNIKSGQPSFVSQMFSTASGRDSCDDYQMVLESLGLQAKQLAVLLAIRERFGIDWNQPLGITNGSSQNIKNQLLTLAKSLDEPWKSMIEAEIDGIPDGSREITPLHLAELLRLIVDDSKPGTFTTTWQNTFGNPGLTHQQFLDGWMNYILTFNSRESFILWSIAGNLRMDNKSVLLKYLLREFEYCLPSGINAHRTSNLEIEHYFARNYSAISALPGHGFPSQADYENNFLDKPGNKLLLDSSLNGSIKNVPIYDKKLPYATGSYGSTSVPISEHTKSAQQIATDIGTCTNLGDLRAYVEFRQLRLAVFAARRF